jgi:type I restriction enzyme M protein
VQELALSLFKNDLGSILTRHLTQKRELVASAFETWWDKYRITLATMEHEGEVVTDRLRGLLVGLGYDS